MPRDRPSPLFILARLDSRIRLIPLSLACPPTPSSWRFRRGRPSSSRCPAGTAGTEAAGSSSCFPPPLAPAPPTDPLPAGSGARAAAGRDGGACGPAASGGGSRGRRRCPRPGRTCRPSAWASSSRSACWRWGCSRRSPRRDCCCCAAPGTAPALAAPAGGSGASRSRRPTASSSGPTAP